MAWQFSAVLDCRLSYLHLPSGRCGHTMCAYEESLILFGGFDGARWLNDTHMLNTISMIWTQPHILGASPEPRQYHSAVLLDTRMYVFGGYSGKCWLNDFLFLDLNPKCWVRPKVSGDVPTGKEGHAMCAVGKVLYVFGGWDGAAVSDLHQLHIDTFTWTHLSVVSARPSVCGHSMNAVQDCLYVFGGYDGKGWSNAMDRLDLQRIPLRWETLETSGCPRPRGYHSSVVVGRFILIYAGYNGTYILGDLLAFDIDARAWSFPDPFSDHSLEARNAHTMTRIGSELYLFGGYNGQRDTNDVHVLESAAFSTLHDDLASLWRCDVWKDVELISSRSRKTIHGAIVRSRCPGLYLDLVEQCPEYPEGAAQVRIPQIWQESLDAFCEYLYTDAIKEPLVASTRKDLILLAERYHFVRLQLLCEDEPNIPESTLALDIMEVRFFTELSDLTILIEGQSFRTHRLILGCRCAYFRAMLQSNMKERLETMIELPGLSASAFNIILDWIYSDKFSPLFSDQALDLALGLALLRDTSVLLLDSLKRMTEIALQKLITVKTVCFLLEASLICPADKLKASCINFILKNFESVAKRDLRELSTQAEELLNFHLPKSLQKQAKSSLRGLALIKLDPKKPTGLFQSQVLNVQGEKLGAQQSNQLSVVRPKGKTFSNRFRLKANTIEESEFRQSLVVQGTSRKMSSVLTQAGMVGAGIHRTRSSLL